MTYVGPENRLSRSNEGASTPSGADIFGFFAERFEEAEALAVGLGDMRSLILPLISQR